ncbi:MAG: methyltransferase domain-containing protein [Planctomycetaceae bacterium]|nr:methyltransferase domain-containing protein [Planctomycetaceae bacterium]
MHRLLPPSADPAPIFELFRGAHGTELLTAAVVEFDLFNQLARQPRSFDELRAVLGLAPRPATVLITALRAMQLLALDAAGRLTLTPLAEQHLTRESPWDVSGYLGLAGDSPGVQAMIARLKTNRPAGQDKPDEGTAFIFRAGVDSAMEREASARHLTLSLAGRARNVAPVLAARYPLADARRLLDIGGGSGLYTIAYLQRYPQLRAVIWDRPEVLKVAQELSVEHGVSDRVELVAGDMFVDHVPVDCDVHLLSNILHDWDVPECRRLVERSAQSLPQGGRLLIHDVLLNDEHDGPLPIALYSASLFSLTEGRAYSYAEYRDWLVAAGLRVEPPRSTLVHCHVIAATRDG